MTLLSTLVFLAVCWWVGRALWRRIDAAIATEERRDRDAFEWVTEVLPQRAPIEVRAVSRTSGGTDIWLDLGDEGVVRLRCYGASTAEVAELRSAVFQDELGWLVDAATPDGSPLRFVAWSIRHRPARASH